MKKINLLNLAVLASLTLLINGCGDNKSAKPSVVKEQPKQEVYKKVDITKFTNYKVDREKYLLDVSKLQEPANTIEYVVWQYVNAMSNDNFELAKKYMTKELIDRLEALSFSKQGEIKFTKRIDYSKDVFIEMGYDDNGILKIILYGTPTSEDQSGIFMCNISREKGKIKLANFEEKF